jgi:hypothetical protein
MRSRNGQRGHLRDLFQVVAGDSAHEVDISSFDEDLDVTQYAVTARTQGVFDAGRQAEIFHNASLSADEKFCVNTMPV